MLVIAAELDELVVRALFNDTALVEHTNEVGMADGGEAVGDGDGGAVLHQSFQGLLHKALTLRVEGAGGFIQNEDRRILQDSTGDADALTLTATETATTVADVSVVAVL